MKRKKYPSRPQIINRTFFKYKQHMFFCVHKHNSKTCCERRGGKDMWHYAKDKIKGMGLHDKGKIRVNKSGCLGFCDSGPVLVIYPDSVWYRYTGKDDIDEIIERHVLGGELVQKLLLEG